MKLKTLALGLPIVIPAAAAGYYYKTTIDSSVREMGVPLTTLLGEHQLAHRDLYGTCYLASITLPEGLRDVPNDQIFAAFRRSLDFPRSLLPQPGRCWLPADRRSLTQLTTAAATTSPDASVPEEMHLWRSAEGHHGAVWLSVKDGFKHGERTHLHFVMGSAKSTAVDEFDFPGGALLKLAHRMYKKYLIHSARAQCVEALFAGAQAVPVECQLKG